MDKADFARVMPAMMAHEGVWEGIYRHVDLESQVIDQHRARVICEFPEQGPLNYVQHNLFTWENGRTQTATLPGTYRDGALWWDTPAFHGKAWESGSGLVLLELWRKDLPGAWFWEIICLAPDGKSRARTWHWFDGDGHLFRRTLCDERRVG
jgi:hypothetical protein